MRAAVHDALRRINGVKGRPESFDLLEQLISEQAYRLSFWRVASDEINYRRFFDVNDLAAVRVEERVVFNAVHEVVLRLLRRGLVTGLTRGTTKAHIARAALEGIGFEIHDLAQAMAKDIGRPVPTFRVDGGASANDLLMQFQADLLGVPVVRPKVLETTALGAAYLAGLTVDLWKSREELASHWQAQRRFEPQMERKEAESKLARWREAVARARNWTRG